MQQHVACTREAARARWATVRAGAAVAASAFIASTLTRSSLPRLIACSFVAALICSSLAAMAASVAAAAPLAAPADGCADDGAPPPLGSVYAGESERAASIARKETDEKLDLPTTEEKNDEVPSRCSDQIVTVQHLDPQIS